MGSETGKSAASVAFGAGGAPPAPAARLAAGGGAGGARGTVLAPGFRFHPTDEELVSYYLKRKICNKQVHVIDEVDIYKNEPWELADKSKLKSRDPMWYFFCALDKKYENGARINRTTSQGYWKGTGNDREICRDTQLLGMKKTLVFYIGRAPGGLRTNWVMHEYRLDTGNTLTDSYVLCRVFCKDNTGPPNQNNHYGPFVEAEWDDDEAAIIPGEDAVDDVVAGGNTSAGTNQVEQDTQSLGRDQVNLVEPLTDLNLFPVCETGRAEDCLLQNVLNTEATFPPLQYEKGKHNDAGSSHSNALENSARKIQGSCSYRTTMVDMMNTSAPKPAVSALQDFSLTEPIKTPNISPLIPPHTFDVLSLGPSVPPSCVKLVNDLQDEYHKISIERETLKLDNMSGGAMLNILKSQIDFLVKENEDLKKTIQDQNAK